MLKTIASLVSLLGLGVFLVALPAVAQAADVMAPSPERIDACRSLEGGQFQHLEGAPTWIVKATYVAATAKRVAYCDVEGYVNPVVNFGLYLPITNWNGKFLERGCGGSCGTVAVELACGDHLRAGYACLHTDMGHRSTLSDNNWTADNLQGLVDFGYRATHVATVAGKAITAAYYGTDLKHAYFFACSTGGRQGMVEAERFPTDFDGIVAIAPASMDPFGPRPDPELVNPGVFNYDAKGEPILPNRKALLVHRAVVRDCDMNDGVKDGLIGDPRLCKFDPVELQCKTADTRDCLTPAQVTVVRKIYDGRGALKGSEFNWIGLYLDNALLPGETRKPLFDLSVGRGDPALVDTFNSPADPDLRPFRNHGGKLIMVHGWADQSVPPLPTIDYYETMTRTMGGPATATKFARLFMIPGMDHCSGGEGAYAVDYVGALEKWVEQNEAPDKLIGYHPTPAAHLDFFSVNLPITDPKLLGWSRPHFAYPKTTVYSGKGDPDAADNYVAR